MNVLYEMKELESKLRIYPYRCSLIELFAKVESEIDNLFKQSTGAQKKLSFWMSQIRGI